MFVTLEKELNVADEIVVLLNIVEMPGLAPVVHSQHQQTER
jgi:hypothetical protein